MSLITPKILQGTRDFLPRDMAKRDFVMDKIKSVFVRFGYDTIETPAIEYSETLLGKYGDEGSKLLYRFKDNGDRDIALRYDQTVPFARLVAMNWQELPMPFKRYQISKVWRADRPAKGRFREFVQCDIDIIGPRSLLAEAEVARLMAAVFQALGFTKFAIKFNSRRLINSILQTLGILDQQSGVLRILDKLDKIGAEGVAKEMEGILGKEKTAALLKIVTLSGTNAEKLAGLREYETAEIEEFLKIARLYGLSEDNLILDISLARGLDYYTGIIYEAYIPEVAIGAVCAGGRFDDLCGLFCDEKFSGVGVAFGFDRVVVAMEELGLLKEVQLSAQVLVTYFDESTLPESIRIFSELSKANLNAEIYFEPAPLGKQFKYADKKEIPFVVIAGPDEIKKGEVTIKVMKTGKQKNIPANQLTSYLTGYTS